MGRLIVMTTPDLALGFQLAGVETFIVEKAEQVEALLSPLLAEDEASLVLVCHSLLQAVSPRLKHQIETSYRPVVMDIPDGRPVLSKEARRHQLTELMRRAIGFQITFSTD